MPEYPSGTIAFLFTDIEGSSARWESQQQAMTVAVERHFALLRAAIESHDGVLFKTIGDAVQGAFATVPKAIAAAVDAQAALHREDWGDLGPLRVRMAIHVGKAAPVDGDYLAPALNRLSRVLNAGYGEQILLTAAARALATTLPPGHDLRDLGSHRLRDLLEAEPIYQLIGPGLPDHFPSLKSLDQKPHNLPSQPTELIGRESELEQIHALLTAPGTRLVTLTGPGGTGKTRLAVQAAANVLDDFPDGVWWAPLAAVTEPALALEAIATILGVREQAGQPLMATLINHARSRRMLLVLDNLEQVLSVGPLLAELLAAAPGVVILATSREPLRLRGEQEFPIAPLSLPDPDDRIFLDAALASPAVQLFLARAQAIKADFVLTEDNAAAIVGICQRLDGLPLAIELAAARVRLLDPAALLARLEKRLSLLTGGARDLPERQQTLRATIAWSHDLLAPPEKALFARLAVFAGGCTFAAALAVADAGSGVDIDLLDGLDSLVQKSLLRQSDELMDEPRLTMLETIREFGLERLAASGREAAVRQRHAAWCLAFAEHAGPLATGPHAAGWLAALEREHANLRAALTWLSEEGDGTRLMRLGVALLLFWQDHAYYREGRQWLETALALGREAPAADRMRALSGAGTMAWYQTDVPRAMHWHERALALARETGDREVEALSLSNLGAQATELGDYERAVASYEASLAVASDAGEPEAMVLALHNLAHVTLLRGGTAVAASRFGEALALAREHGVAWIEPTILNGLGSATIDLGDVEAAAALFREGLTLGQARGNAADVIDALEGLARVSADTGQMNQGARLFGAAATLRAEIAMPQSPTEIADAEPIVNRLRDALGADGFATAWELGRLLSRQEAIDEALAIRVEPTTAPPTV